MTKETAEKLLRLTRQSYEEIAGEFSATRGGLWEDLRDLSKYAPVNGSILDLGCGNGRLYELFKDKGAGYTGFDQSSRLIELARAKWHNDIKEGKADFIVGNALKLPFADGQFDVIFSIAVMAHIPSAELQLEFLRGAKRVLKPGGVLALTNWNLWPINLKKKSVWKYFLEKLFMPAAEWEKSFGISKKDVGFKDVFTAWQGKSSAGRLYYRAFSLSETLDLVKRSGLQIVESYYSGRGKKCGLWKGENIVVVAKKQENP